jgi:hypothetical protein
VPITKSKIDITDERIFGNDAGDDEKEHLLNHYFLEQVEFNRFYDPSIAFRVVKARKGTGKSALLKRTQAIAAKESSKNITLWCKGADIKPDTSNHAVASNLIDAWKQKICTRINREIGNRISLAGSDDAISLVEASELDGFRERNIVSALADRLKVKIKDAAGVPERQRIPIANDSALLERYSQDSSLVFWLLVDDIDATFKNDEESRKLLSAFFSACRDLVQRVNGLVIRCSVRTDVWTILRSTDEALDKCEQYVFNLRWDDAGVGKILENKIYTFFTLTAPELTSFASTDVSVRKREAYKLIFPSNYEWGRGKQIDSRRFLALYSQGRPRWTAKLCRSAALRAVRRGSERIEAVHINAELSSYSLQRRQDLVGEHTHEYSEFNSLLQVFADWQKKFTSQELLKRISERHIAKIVPPAVKPDPVYLAHLLYRSGFINAVKINKQTGKAQYFEYEDRPTLLMSRGNLDEGCDWEIPMFLRKEFGV